MSPPIPQADMAFTRKRYVAVLWDIDGTLIDSEPLHDEAVIVTLRDMGFGDIAMQLDMLGTTWDRIWQAVGGAPPDLPEFERRVAAFYLKNISSLKPRGDVVERVSALHHAGIKQGAASNSRQVIVDANLKHLRPDQYMQAVISRDDCEEGKPHPEPHLNAASRLGVDIRASIAVEDSLRGAESAKAAGAFTLLWPQRTEREADHYDLRISNLADFAWDQYLLLNASSNAAKLDLG
jgi:beta-phosphoglucomutase-like phosphatase (HAD superfamily)